jgi:cysteine sulfinate desulfinase/cysteine desulfurase-like protein
MKKLLESHQFDGLCHTRVAHKLKGPFGVGALFSELNQGTQTRRIDKVDFAEIE